MTALRDALTAVEDELATAIAAVAAKIEALPGAEDITQADIDGLKADAATLEGLAAQAPTEAQPVDENGNPIEVPVEPTNPVDSSVPTDLQAGITPTETTGTDTSGGTTDSSEPTA